MGSTQYGNFGDFCRDSTLPVCNIVTSVPNQPPGLPFEPDACVLRGISLSNDRYLANLGSILVAGLAIILTLGLLWRTERKAAAVGRREIQVFLLGYLVISLCEIFSQGHFPLNDSARRGFSAAHIAAITATTWVLLMNAAVGFQLLDDGTVASLALIMGSALAFFVGTGYIALDTAFNWTGYWSSTLDNPEHRSIALYTLYQLAPLVFLFLFFVLETILVLRILGEVRPMIYLVAAALLFAIGQIFQYVISVHICKPTNGAIDGAFFSSLFTLLSVIAIWVFWSSITEDDWPITG
ncbi:uncharacterized protein HMPREF1541_10982 [Cyphellophora europaea CBS 101466]|uniref:Uncharacterized protein n=1 Tax=Cyphellophora europaea (strain CBS 101466) TaxID=1220924 RepID=W2S587_CYPE1|nr:uncharacterized protein HMPREF1541_10982 [Cyphellophora europaea CBS 101466]ETN43851.1 hypothetical protein HMPREF1541_10982 [Cyphellophora europaea CBS 101466]